MDDAETNLQLHYSFRTIEHIYDNPWVLVVFREQDPTRKFARKVMQRTDTSMERWRQEIDTLQMAHQNDPDHVLALELWYHTPDNYYLITPLADYDLAVYLKRSRKQFEKYKEPGLDCDWEAFGLMRVELLDWIHCLAGALYSLHSKKLVHRDIKPQNILIKNRRVLLADFGLSFVADGTINVGATTSTHGTIKYEPPEAFRGDGEFVRTSFPGDVFSLGCVLYEMVETLFLPARSHYQIRPVEGSYAELIRDSDFDRTLFRATEDSTLVGHISYQYRYEYLPVTILGKLGMVMCYEKSGRVDAKELFSDIKNSMVLYGFPLSHC